MEEITRDEISSSDVLTNFPNSNLISSIGVGGGTRFARKWYLSHDGGIKRDRFHEPKYKRVGENVI